MLMILKIIRGKRKKKHFSHLPFYSKSFIIIFSYIKVLKIRKLFLSNKSSSIWGHPLHTTILKNIF